MSYHLIMSVKNQMYFSEQESKAKDFHFTVIQIPAAKHHILKSKTHV